MPHERRTETSLYEPVKRYLEALGFTVKGEVCGCDLVALRGDKPPIVVIGELKLSFSLDLVLQAVDRTTACDEVWLAVGPRGHKRLCDPRVRKLCRFLGFGLLGVSPPARSRWLSNLVHGPGLVVARDDHRASARTPSGASS